ncbi:NYN domain-containing protein [Photobacterium damselae]|uniref:NYN domain-containing protein n=1 Tax=Photobacterium damselae TaxID=38293 RepID=UPI001F41F4D4|nr:NYN domain-containing protein [Photobacterium damselae]UKA31863.1 NYN domain-containing protein [Photobacterium damselae subsp. damselae]
MPINELPTIALFVDADNTLSSNFTFVIEQLLKRGQIHYRHLYGNWTKPCLSSWHEVGQLHAAQFIQVFDLCSHKNASDIAMVVDILEWNQSHPNHVIAIMTSDSDFTPLLNQLRRHQITTIGIGNANCSIHLQKSFSSFIPIPVKETVSSTKPKTITFPDSKSKILVETARSLNANIDAVPIGMIGSQLKGRLTYPAGKLKKLLQEYPQFFSFSGDYVRLKT